MAASSDRWAVWTEIDGTARIEAYSATAWRTLLDAVVRAVVLAFRGAITLGVEVGHRIGRFKLAFIGPRAVLDSRNHTMNQSVINRHEQCVRLQAFLNPRGQITGDG